jgi:hypothetical protein
VEDVIKALTITHESFVGNGKPVCRPLLTDAVELHEAAYVKPYYFQRYIEWDKTFIIHARNLEVMWFLLLNSTGGPKFSGIFILAVSFLTNQSFFPYVGPFKSWEFTICACFKNF